MNDARQLAEKDPGNVQWKEDLASYHSAMGDMLLQAQETENALTEYQAALDIRQQLANRDTNAAALQFSLALSHANVAAALRRISRPEDALAQARKGSTCWGTWPRAGREISCSWKAPRGREGNIRYKLRIGPGQQEDFRAVFAQGFDAAKTASATDSKNPLLAEQWGSFCSEKAVFALFYGDVAETVDYAQKAADTWRTLSRAAPTNTEYKARLMQACLALGAFQLINQQPQETVKTSQFALKLDPTQAEFKALLVLGFLFDDHYDKARGILLDNRDLKVGPRQTFPEAVLEDLRRLREKGLTQLDMVKFEQRLAADFPKAAE